jgi:putative ABC transport system substrate-binding protein
MFRLLQLLVFVLSAACLSATSSAQQPVKTFRVGFLGPASQVGVFRAALSDLGYVESRNLVIDAKWPDAERLDQLPALAESFVGSKVDVIVAIGATAARVAKTATAEIPIVFAGVVDPVATGLVASLSKPGANVTGATTFDPEQGRRQVDLLKEAIPGLAVVAILGDTGAAPAMFQAGESAIKAAGLVPVVLKVERGTAEPDFATAFATAKKEGAHAVIVLSTPVTTPHRRRIAEASIQAKIPILSPRDHADAGGLLSFGTSFSEATRRASQHVATIFGGAKAGELPIDLVQRHEFVINMKTAVQLGLTLPAAFVKRANEVIP